MGLVPKNPMFFFLQKKRLQKSPSWEVTHFKGDLLATPHLVSFLASMQLAKIGRSQFRHKRVEEEHCDSKKQDLQSCVKRFDFCSPEIHISSTRKGQTWHLQKLLESPEKKISFWLICVVPPFLLFTPPTMLVPYSMAWKSEKVDQL